MYLKLHRYPFVKLTLTLVLGMVCAFQIPPFRMEFVLALLVILVMLTFVFSRMDALPLRNLAGILLLASVGVVGVLLVFARDISNKPQHFAHRLGETNDCIFRIEKVKRNYAVASMLEMDGAFVEGKFMINHPKTLKKLQVFDVLFSQLKLAQINKPLNPAMFDFKRFQASKGVYYRTYLSSYEVLRSDDISWLGRVVNKIRNYCISKLDKIGSTNERAIAKALIIGDKRDIDEDLRNAFADSGAMHVLAVSGLHVGVIYLIISWLFGLFTMDLKLRFFRSAISLIFIWTFAMVAGGTASVCRAAFMFSMLEVGRLLNRSAYPLNSLAAAAFFLLVVDPNAIFDVGFQLSFTAVTGIILLHKPLEELWVIENKWGYKFWSISCVSLAATLFTLPLTIYYFHQFPLYSWLSGIVVVNGAFLILSNGLFYLAMASIPILGYLSLKILYGTLWLLSAFVNLFQKIPYVSIKDVWLSHFELGFVGLALFGLAMGLILRQSKFIKATLLGVLAFSLVAAFFPSTLAPSPAATIYHLPGTSYADFLTNGYAQMLNVDNLENPHERYEVKNHHASYHVVESSDLLNDPAQQRRWPFIKLLNKKILRLEGDLDLNKPLPPVDIVWMSKAASLKNMDKTKNNQLLFVLDGSIDKTTARLLTSELQSLGLKAHDTWQHGALKWYGK